MASGSADPRATIALAGDLGLTRTLLPDPRARVSPALLGLIRSADGFFCNLEFPVGEMEGSLAPWAHPCLRGDPGAWPLLEVLRPVVAGIGTNHVLDGGRRGLAALLARCSASGIGTVGAGLDEKAARTPFLARSGGAVTGFLGYCKKGNFTARGGRPGAALLSLRNLEEDVPRAAASCDFLVVSMHMGMEFCTDVHPMYRDLAQAAVELGAGCVVGHHPHVLNPVEVHRGAPVFYSLGNLLLDNRLGAVEHGGAWDLRHIGAVAVVSFSREGTTWELVPTSYDSDALVADIAEGASAAAAMEILSGTGRGRGPAECRTVEKAAVGAVISREIRTVVALTRLHGPAFLWWFLRDLKPRHLRMLSSWLGGRAGRR